MTRLKLPAYGKRLLLARRAGIHPLEIGLVYGDKWWGVEHPKICVTPADYAPGKFDFCMLAGARVTVYDQIAGACETDWSAAPPTFGKFYDLLAELARADALVICYFSHAPAGTDAQSVLELAESARKASADGKTWPRWWSAEQDKHQRKLIWDWLADKRKTPYGRVAA